MVLTIINQGDDMTITVKLFATLREGRDKIVDLVIDDNTTGVDVLSILSIDISDVAIYLVNGRDASIDKSLLDGDILSIFPPVGGG